MNTDTISVKIDHDINFINGSLVFTLSTLMYIGEYNYQMDFNEFNSSLVVINLFAPLTALQTTLSDSYRETRTGLTIPLTVSSTLRCPLSSPPTLLLTPVSTAGILRKAREVHASYEGLDEAQSADEDSYHYFILFPCVCIV